MLECKSGYYCALNWELLCRLIGTNQWLSRLHANKVQLCPASRTIVLQYSDLHDKKGTTVSFMLIAEPHLHNAASVPLKSSEEKMVIGKVGHLIHYGATLIPIRWGTKTVS